MLTAYFEAAMKLARYEIMENGRFFGAIPKCRGTLAHGKTLEQCRQDLRGALESWILGGLHHGDRLPIVNGIDLNAPRPRKKKSASVHA